MVKLEGEKLQLVREYREQRSVEVSAGDDEEGADKAREATKKIRSKISSKDEAIRDTLEDVQAELADAM